MRRPGWCAARVRRGGIAEIRKLLSLGVQLATFLEILSRQIITGIRVAKLASLKQPLRRSARRFQHVPDIEGVENGLHPQEATLVRKPVCFFARNQVGHVFLGTDRVGFPAEGPEVEDGEDGHFNA